MQPSFELTDYRTNGRYIPIADIYVEEDAEPWEEEWAEAHEWRMFSD